MSKHTAVSTKRFFHAAARALAASALFAVGSITAASAVEKTYTKDKTESDPLDVIGDTHLVLSLKATESATQGGAVSSSTGTGTLTIRGVDSTKQGGTLKFTGINPYNGTITIRNATLEITESGSLGAGTYSGAITLDADASLRSTLLFSQRNDQKLAGVISGTGGLSKNGGLGLLTLSGSNTYTGATTITNGAVVITDVLGANSGGKGVHDYAGDISVSISRSGTAASLELNQTAAQILRGNFTGNGVVSKTGPGKLTLTGGNSGFTGTFSFTNGTVSIGNDSNLAGGTRFFDGVTAELTGVTYSKGWTIGEHGVTISNTGDVEFKGALTRGAGGTLTKTGAGKLTLTSTGNGNFAGDTIVLQGTLSISADSNVGKGEHTLHSGTTLELASGSYAKNWTLDAGTTPSTVATVSVTAGNAKFTGNISGAGALVKTGAGTLEISPPSGTSVPAGSGVVEVPLTVREGALAGSGTLGAVTFDAGTTIAPGGVTTAIGKLNLGVEGGTTSLNDITLRLNLSGTAVSDSINIAGNANFGNTAANTVSVPIIGTQTTWATGAYTILQTTGNLNVGNLGNTVFEYAGVELDPANSRFRAALSKVTDAETGGDKLVLNTYATASLRLVWNGLASVGEAGGQWVKGDTTAADPPTPNNWREGDTAGRWFQNGDIVEFADSTEGAPAVRKTIAVTSVGNGVIVGGMTVGGSNYVFEGGKIGGATTSTISPEIAGDGKLSVLEGASARFNNALQFINIEISGEAVFNGATGTGTTQNPLKINNTGKMTLADNGSFHSNGNGVPEIVNNGLLVFDRNENFNYTVTEKISGTGSVEKTGTGVLTLSGANTYTGDTTVRGGKLAYASDANIGAGVNTLDGGALQLVAGARSGEVTYSKSWVLGENGGTFETSNSVRFGVTNITDPDTGETAPAPALGQGDISGPGALTKTGNGTLTLDGASTYAGSTTVRAGTLRIWGDWGVAGTDPEQTTQPRVYEGEIVLAGGGLVLDQKNPQTLSGKITRALVDRVDAEGNTVREPAANASITKRGENTLVFAGVTTARQFEKYVNEGGVTQVEGVFEVETLVNGTSGAKAPREGETAPPAVRFEARTVVGGNVTNYADGVFSAEKITAQTLVNDGELRAGEITGDIQNRAGAKLYLPSAAASYDIGGNLTNGGTVYFTAPRQVLRVNNLDVPSRNTAYYNITINPEFFSDPSQTPNHISVADDGEVKGSHVFLVENAADIAGETVAREFSFNLIQGGTIDPSASIRLSAPLNVGVYQLTITGQGDSTLYVTGYSPLGQAVVNTVAAIPFSWFSQLDNLSKRQGELRLGLFAKEEIEIIPTITGKKLKKQKNPIAAGDRTEGFWVRGYGSQITTDLGIEGVTDFDEYQFGSDVGYDHAFALNDENKLFLGTFLGFQGARRHFNDGYGSYGDARSIGGGVYSTWVNRNGWYADALAKAQSFHNEFRVLFESPRFNTAALGFSLEFGKRFDFSDAWFVEPSVAAAYTYQLQKSFRAIERVSVDADDGHILRATAALRAGKAINLEELGVLVAYVRVGVENQSSSGGEIRVGNDATFSPDLDGTRVMGGVGAAWQFDNSSQVHFDFETAFGDKYEKPWAINVGYRLRF